MITNLFDANFYRAANPDLAAAGLTTDTQLLSHFQNNGLNEGRAFSPFVNLSFYSSSNPDLAAAGLTSNQQLFNHLQNAGVAEGRRFSPFVDLGFYLAANPDINQAFAGNREQAFNHLRNTGVQEGRIFSPYEDTNFYLAANPDINQFFGGDRLQALEHLELNGLAEGRQFSQFFNLKYYAANNPDLEAAGLNNGQLLNHFEISGLREGRTFSPNFDVNYYRNVNPDLESAGLNNRQLYEHFELNGVDEGRRSSPSFNVSYYLANNADLRAAGFNYRQAYDHFVLRGQAEGRRGSEPGSPLLGSAPDWFSQNITDPELQTVARNRARDGILDRNDMLAIFRTAEDGPVINANEVHDLKTLVANSTRFRMPDYVQYLSAKVADGASTNMSSSTFESTLVGRWFLGTVAPTAQFNNTSLTYTQVKGSLYGSSGHARIGDIDQISNLNDCTFLTALGATFTPQFNDGGDARSSVIDSMIVDNGDNTYTIRFYSGSSAEYVTVDRRLATTSGSIFGASANGSSDPNSTSNILWVPLVERAYAQWREGREGAPGYNLIGNSDTLVRPLQFVTGRTATHIYTNSLTFSTLETALSNGKAVDAARYSADSTTYIAGGHSYTVTNAYINSSGQQRVVVRNPWGVDGRQVDGANDGFINLSFSDFVSNLNGVAIA